MADNDEVPPNTPVVASVAPRRIHTGNVGKMMIRKLILYGLMGVGWLLAVLFLAVLVDKEKMDQSLNGMPEDPFPSTNVIAGATFLDYRVDDWTEHGERALTGRDLRELSLVFEGSRKDQRPAKWVCLGRLSVSLVSGHRVNVELFYTHRAVGAYKLNNQYYRGGNDQQFERIVNQILSQPSDAPAATNGFAVAPSVQAAGDR